MRRMRFAGENDIWILWLGGKCHSKINQLLDGPKPNETTQEISFFLPSSLPSFFSIQTLVKHVAVFQVLWEDT